MSRFEVLRSALFAGWSCLVLGVLAGAAVEAAPNPAAVDDPTQLLKQADKVKSENRSEFASLVRELDSDSARLTPNQQMQLRYLKAWQSAYFGDLAIAITQLNAIIEESNDPTLKFRAGATVVNALVVAMRNEEAYTRLGALLDQLPQVSDPDALRQGLTVAAILYTQAGQYELGLEYANRLIARATDSRSSCAGHQLRFKALFESGRLRAIDKEYQQGLAACQDANEPVYTGLIRVDAARFDIAQGRYSDAIKLLQDSYEETKGTRYARLISAVDSALGQAYWKTGDAQKAEEFARRAIDGAVRNETTEPLVDAYHVLYEVAKQQGSTVAALEWHEKYAAADKGYLNNFSARALAYQMVRQQVQAKKQQMDALNKANQVLKLKQQVDAKSAEAGKLLILLLVTVLGSIAMYAFRTKRSEVKFMKLARRDGLTDIYNRQYFVEASGHELQYCQKSVRDVSVIVIDLDHFKQINDTHGHAAGDFALKRAVAMCQQHLRSVDVFGRLGGEEFGILMPDCVPERAADQAELMRLSIERLVNSDEGPEFPVRASFGISAARWSGYELRQLLAHADSALYQAKREGRNRVCVYTGATAANSSPPPDVSDRRRTVTFSTGEDARR